MSAQLAIYDMQVLGETERDEALVWLRGRVNEMRADLGMRPREVDDYVETFRQISVAVTAAYKRMYQAVSPVLKKLANDETVMRYAIQRARERNDQDLELWATQNLDRILQEKQL